MEMFLHYLQTYSGKTPPVVNVIQGPIVSEVHVYFDLVTHVVRLYNSSGNTHFCC